MYQFGTWPKSVGGTLVLYPNSSKVLCTDPDATVLATRKEFEDNLPAVMVYDEDDDKYYAVVSCALHSSAATADTVYVLKTVSTALSLVAYTVNENAT